MNSSDTYVQSLLHFVGQHPALAAVVVFLAALSEAVPVIGAVVPGSAIVVGVSAFVGLGHLPIWPILIAAVLGAIIGDGVSYWFGRRYKAQALSVWPLSRYPGMVETSERFFGRHGSKSVAIARFTPVVRAFVPLIAGASGMPPIRFYAANVVSAIAWAPVHVLPGAAVGASLGTLGGMSARTLVLLAMVAATAVVLTWLISFAWQAGFTALGRLQNKLFNRLTGQEGRFAEFLRSIVDPDKPGPRNVALLGGILSIVVLALVNLVENVLARGELTRADAAVANLVSDLRSAWSDSILVFVTTLADTPITAVVGLAVAGWVWWLGRRNLALGFAALAAVTALFALGLKATTRIPRPNAIYTGAVEFSFPSGHVTFATAIYGVIGWLVARDLDRPWRGLALGCVGGLIAVVAISRIYLGAHWPSDVAAGLLYGIGAIAVFALVFRSLRLSSRERLTTAAVALAALGLVGGWHVSRNYAVATDRYIPQAQAQTNMTNSEWRAGGWQSLPAERVELGGDREDLLVLQWAGDAKALAAALALVGWALAPELSFSTLNRYLSSRTSSWDLPALPKLHDGRAPELTLIDPVSSSQREVMRIWRSRAVLSDGPTAQPILLASITRERIEHPFGILTFSRKREDHSVDIAALENGLPNATVVMRTPRVKGGLNQPKGPQVLAAP
jgi:membrane protein DedA with SNARE-associated domain/membrane-associated phospholipid phosphatase